MDTGTSSWWVWIVLGLLFLFAEAFLPAKFYVLFFGLGAIAVGLLALVGLAGPFWAQELLFVFLSIGALVLFRTKLLERVRGTPEEVDNMVGEMVLCLNWIAPGETGKVELRGTVWSAKNFGTMALEQDRRYPVLAIDGLTICLNANRKPAPKKPPGGPEAAQSGSEDTTQSSSGEGVQ